MAAVTGKKTMSKIIYALLPLVVIGCGQAEPEPEPTEAPASQQEQLEANRDRIAASSDDPAAPTGVLPNAAAGGNSKFRCMNDDLPRSETVPRTQSLVAEPSLLERVRPAGRKRLPVRPEVIESVPSHAAAAEPEQD
jgi:hypothetical protein